MDLSNLKSILPETLNIFFNRFSLINGDRPWYYVCKKLKILMPIKNHYVPYSEKENGDYESGGCIINDYQINNLGYFGVCLNFNTAEKLTKTISLELFFKPDVPNGKEAFFNKYNDKVNTYFDLDSYENSLDGQECYPDDKNSYYRCKWITYKNKSDLQNVANDLLYFLKKYYNLIEAIIKEEVNSKIVDDMNKIAEIKEARNSLYGSESLLCKKIDEIFEEYNQKQLILTGAPGTGKTYTVRDYVKMQVGDMEDRMKFVQFHSSYDYTDFIEGLRPVILGDNDTATFVRMDGVFMEFCRKAAKNTANNYYFVIDEINRADLSKVFGEIMFCLEESYRGPENTIKTQYSNLPTYYIDSDGKPQKYSKPDNPDEIKDGEDVFCKGFYIPENVYIIGTMNDIDRSVESFDFALRRRFRWLEVDANDYMEESLKAMGVDNENFCENIKAMNKIISGEERKDLLDTPLGKAYCIGAAYFKNYDENTWEQRIEPLLAAYTIGQDENKVKEFIQACKEALTSGKSDENKSEETENAAENTVGNTGDE